MIYAVIDTNVLVSAYITHSVEAAISKVVDYLLHGKLTPIYNDEMMAEYEEVLSRTHFHISPLKRQNLFEYIRQKGVAQSVCQLIHCSRMKVTVFSMKWHFLKKTPFLLPAT